MDTPQSTATQPDLSTIAPIGVDGGEHLIRKKELVAVLAALFPGISMHDLADAIDRAGGK
jgi:hypothetical protein